MKVIFLILITFITYNAYAVDLGKIGATYEILEKDILQVMKDRATNTDWKSIFDAEKKKLEENIGKIDRGISKTEKDFTRYIDLTTTLDKPIYIRDNKTGEPKALYPKGYTFNVLDHVSTNTRFIFFDASREEELRWFKENYKDNLSYMPIIARGNALHLSDDIGREVYFIDDEHINKFKISKLPVIIYQEKNKLRADEYFLRSRADEK